TRQRGGHGRRAARRAARRRAVAAAAVAAAVAVAATGSRGIAAAQQRQAYASDANEYTAAIADTPTSRSAGCCRCCGYCTVGAALAGVSRTLCGAVHTAAAAAAAVGSIFHALARRRHVTIAAARTRGSGCTCATRRQR